MSPSAFVVPSRSPPAGSNPPTVKSPSSVGVGFWFFRSAPLSTRTSPPLPSVGSLVAMMSADPSPLMSPEAMNSPARLAGSATKMSLDSSLAGVPARPVDMTCLPSKMARRGPPLAAAMQMTSRKPSPFTSPSVVRSPPRNAESEIPKWFDTSTGAPFTRW